MDDKTLLLTFIGLVVYEKHFDLKFGSTTPASFCFRELLRRIDKNHFDRDFIYDVGDWAAEYSDNGYVPMGNYRGYGPRQYFSFLDEYVSRIASEKTAKEERLANKRAEGEAKVNAAKQKKQERINTIQELREKTIEESIQIIGNGDKSVFYYIELIEEWFLNNALDDNQKERIMSIIPMKSTKHNNRKRRYLESIY